MCRMITPWRIRQFASTIVAFFLLSFAVKAQDTIVISFSCGQVVFGEQICIPVEVENFTNVTAFSLLVTWDPTVLRLTGVQNEIFAPNGSWNAPGPNDLRYIWGDLSGLGQDLPDGSALFEICFEAIGVPGETSVISSPPFVLNPFNNNEFANPDAEAIPFVSVPCVVEVTNPVTVMAILSTCGSPDGVSNGSFMITAVGGTAPYNYSWSGPSNGNGVLASLGASATQSVPPGNYTITIMDSGGGNRIYMITVAANEINPVITILKEVTCFNFTNGRIEVGTLGGAHPISVLWQNTTNPVYTGSGYLQTLSDALVLNSLPVGDYLITLIDNNGCVREEMVNLNAIPILIDAVATDASCIGAMDGSVNVSFSGGHPYSGGIYRITPGWGGGSFMTTYTIGTAPVLGPGDYWVEVCDSINGCCARDTFTVGAMTEISASFLPEPPTCFGINDGRLVVNGLTNGVGSGPYVFQLFDSAKVALYPPSNPFDLIQYSDRAPGNYFVVVVQGMCRSDTLPVTIPPAVPIMINLLSVSPSGCLTGQGTGQISVMATGGSPGYTYSWDGGAMMGAMISGVTSGNHFLTVTDSKGCTQQLTVNVPQATGPVIDTIIATNIGCAGGDATLEVVFTEGSSPVTVIDWSTGDSTAIITGVPSGNVTVLIRDSLFCFDISNFDVPEMSMVRIDSLVVENPTCIGDINGQIAVFVSQGIEPYTYIWSTGDTTSFNLLPGLTAGTYGITVVDSDTCNITIDTTITLSDPVAPTFMFSAVTDAGCWNTCDGAATLIPQGGMPGLPYHFIWPSGLMDTAFQSTASDLCPGYQHVIISQDDLCFYEDSVFIPAPQPVGMDTVAISDVSCFGLADASLSVQGTGGTSPWMYSWDVLPPGPVQNQLSAGTYNLTVTDNNGCTFTQIIEIHQPDSLILQIDSSGLSQVNCNSANSGVITLIREGGNGGYTYTWDPAVSTSSIATGVSAGLYSITVTDALGCTDTTSILMTGPSPVIGYVPIIDDPLCFGSLAFVTVDSASGGNGAYTWNINGGQAHPLGTLVEVPAGVYNVITQDTSGCRDTVQIFVNNPPPLGISILPNDPVINLGDSIMLQVFIQGMQVPIDSVTWINNGPLSCYDCPTPYAMNVVPTVYTVTVWDENGCSATLDVLVDVNNQRQVFVPNIFSPNFDGRNDDLVLYTGQGITGIPSMRIFDRWGEVLVEQKNLAPNPGGIVVWDGTFRDQMMTPGVYVYFIEVEFANGETLKYRGDITLVR